MKKEIIQSCRKNMEKEIGRKPYLPIFLTCYMGKSGGEQYIIPFSPINFLYNKRVKFEELFYFFTVFTYIFNQIDRSL